jgi:hypothetical protein
VEEVTSRYAGALRAAVLFFLFMFMVVMIDRSHFPPEKRKLARPRLNESSFCQSPDRAA